MRFIVRMEWHRLQISDDIKTVWTKRQRVNGPPILGSLSMIPYPEDAAFRKLSQLSWNEDFEKDVIFRTDVRLTKYLRMWRQPLYLEYFRMHGEWKWPVGQLTLIRRSPTFRRSSLSPSSGNEKVQRFWVRFCLHKFFITSVPNSRRSLPSKILSVMSVSRRIKMNSKFIRRVSFAVSSFRSAINCNRTGLL